jgi:hypothetical protein
MERNWIIRIDSTVPMSLFAAWPEICVIHYQQSSNRSHEC